MATRTLLRLTALTAVALLPAAAASADPPIGAWSPQQAAALLATTRTVRLAPDLSSLSPGERAAVDELLAAGEILQRVYEDQRHPEAAAARQRLAAPGAREDLATLYRLFQGPIATTLENRREPFLGTAPESPGKAVWPWGITAAEVEAFLAAHPAERDAILGERTAVRRAEAGQLAADRAALARHPALSELHPGLADRLAALAGQPDPQRLYAVPYAVAWADELVAVKHHLFRAADAVEAEDPEFARYLRNRGRDLLTNDYESGDAAWVTGRYLHLNAQIGAYETYDDALFGVKAFHSLSLLVRDDAATAALARGLGGLQEIENALPWESDRTVRTDIPVGVYHVVADFGQARGTNTATILPNDALFARRYGRTILMRANIITHSELAESAAARWRAAMVPELAGALAPEGGLYRTLWHEIGHYLGVDRTADGRPLDQALQSWADALEEMKSDLVSLFAHERFHAAGTIDDARLTAVRAGGILRTLQNHRPRPDQPYQTMQLAQFNFFLERGLIAFADDGRLTADLARYPGVVRALLTEVLAQQRAGDPAQAAAFFARWTGWDERHEALAARLREAQGKRYSLVRYAALGE